MRSSGLGRMVRALGRLIVRPRLALYDFSYLDRLAPEVAAAAAPRALADLEVVVLDTETTGLRPRAGDRLVALGAVRVRAGTVDAAVRFDTLVRPGRAIPAAATRIHGITDAMVAGAPEPAAALRAFLAFAGGAALAGHDVAFDLAFLEPELARLGLPSLADRRPVLDTRLLSAIAHGPGAHDLDSVAQRMGVVVEGRHSALGDARAAADILVRLLPLLHRRAITTLGAALAASRALRAAPPR